MAWNCNAFSSWAVTITASQPRSVSIAAPLHEAGSAALELGEQLVFARQFEGHSGKHTYYEILQKFIHVSGLRYMEERN